MKYSKEQLKTISDKLNAMPTVEKQTDYNKKDSVKLLAKDIEKLRKRGYSFEGIAKILSQEGLSITTQTLKRYLLSAAPAKKQAKPNIPPTELTLTEPSAVQQTSVPTNSKDEASSHASLNPAN